MYYDIIWTTYTDMFYLIYCFEDYSYEGRPRIISLALYVYRGLRSGDQKANSRLAVYFDNILIQFFRTYEKQNRYVSK